MHISYLQVWYLLSSLVLASPISDGQDDATLQLHARKHGDDAGHYLATITPKPHAVPVTLTQQGQAVTTYISERVICNGQSRCKGEYIEKVYDWYSTTFGGPLGRHTITDGSQTITFYASKEYGDMTSHYCSKRGACTVAERVVMVPTPTTIHYPQMTEIYHISPYKNYERYLKEVSNFQHGHATGGFVFSFHFISMRWTALRISCYLMVDTKACH